MDDQPDDKAYSPCKRKKTKDVYQQEDRVIYPFADHRLCAHTTHLLLDISFDVVLLLVVLFENALDG